MSLVWTGEELQMIRSRGKVRVRRTSFDWRSFSEMIGALGLELAVPGLGLGPAA
jgi:hypothetical protein